jgi:hypothetical protein
MVAASGRVARCPTWAGEISRIPAPSPGADQRVNGSPSVSVRAPATTTIRLRSAAVREPPLVERVNHLVGRHRSAISGARMAVSDTGGIDARLARRFLAVRHLCDETPARRRMTASPFANRSQLRETSPERV